MLGCIVANRMSIDKDTLLTNKCDIRMREDSFYSTPQLRHHLRHPFTSLSKGSRVYIGLRWDATYIQTSTADLSSLEDNDLQPLLGGIFSGAVTTRARADDNQISFFH